jgi:hypothetical protein
VKAAKKAGVPFHPPITRRNRTDYSWRAGSASGESRVWRDRHAVIVESVGALDLTCARSEAKVDVNPGAPAIAARITKLRSLTS